jgi:hypothetical protein
VRAAALALVAAVLAGAGPARAQEPEAPGYDVLFEATVVPTEHVARARIRVTQSTPMLLRVKLRIDPARHADWSADGELVPHGEFMEWRVPKDGGSLRYTFRIDHLRNSQAYDARCAENWAIFRGSDLFPPAHVVTTGHDVAKARLRLRVPDEWSVAVPYEKLGDGSYRVEDPSRRFDRPTAWIALGKIGVLRETISGTKVAVAGPIGQGVRRHDMLALLRWTLPSLRKAMGTLPERLLVVSASDPMWRGGLSGPQSVFLHARRPLIANDTTSPLLHELIHAVTSARASGDGDWIAEGLAEYYSLELLVRSHTISRTRHARALAEIEKRGRGARLDGVHSSGASTARAVGVLRALDRELRSRTEGAASLDRVLAEVARSDESISVASFRAAAERASGLDLSAFFAAHAGDVRTAAVTGGR